MFVEPIVPALPDRTWGFPRHDPVPFFGIPAWILANYSVGDEAQETDEGIPLEFQVEDQFP